jgi:Protein of unknown function (DUF3365)
MARLSLTAAAAASIAIGICSQAAGAADQAELAAEGKALIQEFSETLKAELMAAMEKGGPVEAIAVCNTRAPEIAAAVSKDGWTVARSSHRLRNPENAPDAYTAAAIEDFLAREAAGQPAADLVRAEIVEDQGGHVFRMVKAIPTAGLCVSCHGGEEVAPEVRGKLAELYPQDQARGFSEGEMRGVFTLKKPVD